MGEGVCDGSAHVTNSLFLFGRVLWFSGSGGLGAPHTSQTCFFFWAGTLVLWLGRTGRSAHVTNLLFLFGRVLLFSDVSLLGAPHTSQTRFFFLGGYFCSLTLACWALRTRHKLAFSFWAGTLVLWLGRAGHSAHVTNLLFLLGGYYRFSDHAFLAKSLSGMTHLAKNRLRTRISRITAPSSPRKNRARRSAPDSVPSFPGSPNSPNSPVFPNSPNLPQSPFPTLSSQPASTSQIAFSKICNPSSISSFLTLSGVANRMPFP